MPPETPSAAAIAAAILARFPGATLAPTVPAPGSTVTFRESFSGFFDHAPGLWRHGWPAFPQTREAESRRPAPCVAAIKHLRAKLPTARERVDWMGYTPPRGHRVNAAVVVQDSTFVLDVDVRDARADAIEDLAREHLGPTPFVRRTRGSQTRGLIYRIDSSLAERRKSAHKLLTEFLEVPKDETGRPLDDAVELLMPGSVYTVAGAHYRTSQLFRWDGAAPWDAAPDAAPVVTHAMLEAFLDAVEALVAPLSNRRAGEGFNRAAAATGAVSPTTVDASGLVTPGNVQGVDGVTWLDGKVVDGRDQYVLKRGLAYAGANARLAETAEGRAALAAALLAECRANWDGVGSKFSAWDGGGSSVLAACRRQVETGRHYVKRNPQLKVRLGREENGRVVTTLRTAIAVDRGADQSLRWVEASKVSIKAIAAADADRLRRERALVHDPAARAAGQQKVSDAVRTLAREFLADVAANVAGAEEEFPIRVGRFPTGAGKTSTLVEILGRGVPGPILFLLPSYANIEEQLARHRAGKKAKPDLVTPTFRAAAAEAVAAAREAGLDVQVMTGKERGGCLMKDHIAACRAHHAPAQGLCEKDVKGPGDEKPVKVFCRHHPDNEGRPESVAVCPVILARRKLLSARVIFAPTAFLTQVLPAGLKKHIRGLIVDERCSFELLRYDTFPARVLDEARPEPLLYKDEREQGLDPQDLLRDRDEIARVASKALAGNEDVAEAVLAHERRAGNGRIVRGPELLDAAVAVAGRGQAIARAIRPNMGLDELTALLSGPRADYLRQEARFWALVRERVEARQSDIQAAALNTGVTLTRLARGDRDVRVQSLAPGIVSGKEGATVRISWVAEPTLDGVPTLLLDASADQAIVAKAFSGRDVVMTDVDAYLHMQVVACLDAAWGSSSFHCEEGADDERKEGVARNVGMARKAVTNVAATHGQGRVAVFGPMKSRMAVQAGWAEPANVDIGHFGALVGLDFAKHHGAVVTLGRHEFPAWIYDALAAACSYTDEDPELPFDRYGDGLGEDKQPLRMPRKPRTYKLRDGRDVTVEVSAMPGVWGHRIQRQFREEELRQAAGRLRPVYRDAVGTWIAVSNVLPEGTVIDAVTSLQDLSSLAGAGAVYEAIRRVGAADPALIRAQAPDALRHPEHDLRRFGLIGSDLSSPYAAGMDALAVTVDGEERTVQVPAWHGEHVQDEAIEAYDRSGLSVRGIRVLAQGGLKVPSQVKAPDKVDAALGTREERLERERGLRDEARRHVQPDEIVATFPATLAAFDAATVDVSRAMTLMSQMGCDGPTAARLGGSAPRQPGEPISLPEAPAGADAGTGSAGGRPSSPRPAESPRPGAPAVPPGAPRPSRLAALRARRAPDA